MSPGRPPCVQPRALEDLVDLFYAQAGNLGDHKIHVYKTHEAPSSKEEERAPVIGSLKEVGNGELNRVNKQPVKGLTNSPAKGSDAVGPQLTTKDVR